MKSTQKQRSAPRQASTLFVAGFACVLCFGLAAILTFPAVTRNSEPGTDPRVLLSAIQQLQKTVSTEASLRNKDRSSLYNLLQHKESAFSVAGSGDASLDTKVKVVPTSVQAVVTDDHSFLEHRNWAAIRVNPNWAEKTFPCSVAAATEENRKGIDVITAYLEHGWKQEGTSMATSLAHFVKARELDPQCATPLLNLAIMTLVTGDHNDARQLLEQLVVQHPLLAKAHLYLGFACELTGREPTPHYVTARDLMPGFYIDYFALKADTKYQPVKMFRDYGVKSPQGRQIETEALLKMLALFEYNHLGMAAMQPLKREDAVRFATSCYLKIPQVFSGYGLEVYRGMFISLIQKGELKYGDPQVPTRYGHSNDMVSKFLLGVFNDQITRIAGRLTKPTYTYFGGYTGHSILHPHTDRLACEFTFTIQVHLDPVRPLWSFLIDGRPITVAAEERGGSKARPPAEHMVSIDLEPGDGGLIRGRKVIHFRDYSQPNQTAYSIFFHYVWDDFSEDLFGK